jgi:hypothetical protein
VESSEFFVMDKFCDQGTPCTVSKGLEDNTTINVTQTGFAGTIGVLVDGSADVPDLCGGGSSTGDDFRIEVRPLTGNTEITWRFTKSKRLNQPSNGQTYELCVGSKLAPGGDPGLMPFPVANGDGLAVEDPDDPGRYWGVLKDAPSSTKCNASYSIPYPTKISENANGADAIQVACFPYPFDPKGVGIG